MNHRSRLVAATLLVLVPAAAGTAGCSFSAQASPAGAASAAQPSAPPPAPPSGSPAGSATPPAAGSGVSTCQAQQLEPSLGDDPDSPDGTSRRLSLVNDGPGSCVLHGYPGLAFTTRDGHIIGAAAARTPAQEEPTFTLEVGGSAHAAVRIRDHRSYPDSTCLPVDASTLSVYPPNQEGIVGPIPVEWTTCSSSRTSLLAVGPLAPGG